MSNAAVNVIEKCGGAETVANWLGVDLSRVYRWTYPRERGGTGGIIPAKHQLPLLTKARASGVDLQPADFFYTPSRSPNEGEAAARLQSPPEGEPEPRRLAVGE
jgi:hypothetical protein